MRTAAWNSRRKLSFADWPAKAGVLPAGLQKMEAYGNKRDVTAAGKSWPLGRWKRFLPFIHAGQTHARVRVISGCTGSRRMAFYHHSSTGGKSDQISPSLAFNRRTAFDAFRGVLGLRATRWPWDGPAGAAGRWARRFLRTSRTRRIRSEPAIAALF